MQGTHAALLLALLLASGCLGASSAATTTSVPNRPYTEVAILPVPNVDVREPDCDPRPCAEYYHVQVYGSENATLVQGPDQARLACQKPWLFTATVANRTLQYQPTAFKPNRDTLKSIISTNFWGATVDARGVTEGCPTSYHLEQYPSEFPQAFARPLGSYGPVKFNVYRDGLIAFEEQYFVPLGEKLVVSYARQRVSEDATFYVKGGFEIVNLGPWPVERLAAQAAGTVSRTPG